MRIAREQLERRIDDWENINLIDFVEENTDFRSRSIHAPTAVNEAISSSTAVRVR
jgi:hypothetical protein